MTPMGPVKLPPLACGQRSEDGMVQNLDARAVALFALRDELVHGGNLGADVGQDFLRGHASGTAPGRATCVRSGNIRSSVTSATRHSLLESGHAGQRLPGFQTALKSLLGPGVGQIEMLEYFRRAPLPFRDGASVHRRSCREWRKRLPAADVPDTNPWPLGLLSLVE